MEYLSTEDLAKRRGSLSPFAPYGIGVFHPSWLTS